MKKMIFSGLLAITAVIVFSGFKSPSLSGNILSKRQTVYYFQVYANFGNQSAFFDNQVFFLPNLPSSNPCASPGIFRCVVGFTASHVTGTYPNIHLANTGMAHPYSTLVYTRNIQ